MPERIPELDRLASAAKEVPVPTASEIRRRGDRRRTTRRVVGGTGACALLLVAGFGAFQALAPDTPDVAEQSPTPTASTSPSATTAPSPTPTPTQPSPTPSTPAPTPTTQPSPTGVPAAIPPTWDNVATPEMLALEGDIPLIVSDEYEGKGQAPQSFCMTDLPGAPSRILTRVMGFGEGDPSLYSAVVFGYADSDQAAAAFDQLREDAVNCDDALVDLGFTDPKLYDYTDQVSFTPPGDVTDAGHAYILGMAAPADETSVDGRFVETTLIRQDERVLMVFQSFLGQDYNCSTDVNDDVAGPCRVIAGMDEMGEALNR